jgi:hypothetical protein
MRASAPAACSPYLGDKAKDIEMEVLVLGTSGSSFERR